MMMKRKNIPAWLETAIKEAEAVGVHTPMNQGWYRVRKDRNNRDIYLVKGLGRDYIFFYKDESVLDDEVTSFLEARLKVDPLLYVSEEDLNYHVRMKDQYKRKLVRNIAKEYLENEIYPLEESEVYRIADLDPTHFIDVARAEIFQEKKAEIERVLDKYPILYPMKELGMPIGELLREVDMDIVGLIQVIQDEHRDYLEEGPRGHKVTYLKSGAVVVTER